MMGWILGGLGYAFRGIGLLFFGFPLAELMGYITKVLCPETYSISPISLSTFFSQHLSSLLESRFS